MPSPETLPIYVIVASEPEEPEAKPLEVFMERPRADQYVLDGLLQALMMHRNGEIFKPGDQISMIMTRGTEDDERLTSGSLAFNGAEHRHVWDFRVEKRWAPRR